MPKALRLLTLCVALTMLAASCSVEADVALMSEVDGRAGDGASATTSDGTTAGQPDDTVASTQSAATSSSGDQSCNYLGTDVWDDMQIEVLLTSDVATVSDTEIQYSVVDGNGSLVHDSTSVITQVTPGEVLRFHIDTLYEPVGSDTGYGCRVDAVTSAPPAEDLLPPSEGDQCVFVELDSWDDIQIRLEYTSPFNGDPLISYALRDRDGVRFESGYALPAAAPAGQVVDFPEDTVRDLPEWMNESDVTCEILGFSEG